MDIGLFGHFVMNGLSFIASLFILAVGVAALLLALMFIADVGQTRDPIRRNYPVIGISAMSYGALSRPAVQALSNGAKLAGCWLNTGEGGLAPLNGETSAFRKQRGYPPRFADSYECSRHGPFLGRSKSYSKL